MAPFGPRITAMTCAYYRTSSPVTALPMIMRWISDVPSKIVKIVAVRAVCAARWRDAGRRSSTDPAPRYVRLPIVLAGTKMARSMSQRASGFPEPPASCSRRSPIADRRGECCEDGRLREALIAAIRTLGANRPGCFVLQRPFLNAERGHRTSGVVPGLVRGVIDPLRHRG
jgi:hypothetical protein